MLYQEACHQLKVRLVMSHLDYMNAVLRNLPQTEIKKLQRIENMAAKVVLCKNKYESSCYMYMCLKGGLGVRCCICRCVGAL